VIPGSLPTEPTTIGLVLLLILAFTLGFKLIQALFNTVLVTALSALFYVALSFLLDYSLTVDRVLTFAILGSTLYIGINTASALYSTASTLLSVPRKIIGITLYPFKKLYSYLKQRATGSQVSSED